MGTTQTIPPSAVQEESQSPFQGLLLTQPLDVNPIISNVYQSRGKNAPSLYSSRKDTTPGLIYQSRPVAGPGEVYKSSKMRVLSSSSAKLIDTSVAPQRNTRVLNASLGPNNRLNYSLGINNIPQVTPEGQQDDNNSKLPREKFSSDQGKLHKNNI